MMQRRIRVYIIHRFQILVDVLSESMTDCPEVYLVGAANEIKAVASTLNNQQVDVLLIDPDLFDSAAREYVRELGRWLPQLKIVPLGLSSHAQILEHIEAGANGYVAEDASFDQLIATIRGVYNDQAPCSAQVAASVSARMMQLSLESDGREPHHLPEDVKLTPKEHQVLSLAARNMANKEIASDLEIALSTVKIHIHRILGKLKANNRREAIQMAFEAGLLEDQLP